MFANHYKKFLAAILIIAALITVRFVQAPVHTGAVLNAFTSATSTPAELRVVFFDVGQGDSSLIIAPDGEDILVDGGPNKTVIQKLGEFLPFDDRAIEYIILSHPHSDHVNGLVEVLKRYEVKKIIMTGAVHTAPDYLEFLELIRDKNIPVAVIDRPQDLSIDGIKLQFLEPDKSFQEVRPENLNNSSIVFKLIYGSTSAMFMGDFENEELLASSSSVLLKSDLVKVGHHGSTNANSKDFLSLVSPKFAIISVGKDNKFGHPHFRTVYYLEALASQIFRTDEQGDVKFESDGQKWQKIK